MMKRSVLWGVGILLGLADAGCKQGESSGGAPSASATPTPSATAAPVALPPHQTGPSALVDNRAADIKFVKFSGAGKKRRAHFKVTNHSGKPASLMQSWIYYYDAKGKLLNAYPHAFGADKLANGSTLEQDLGLEGDKIPEKTHTVEGEITGITFEGGNLWANENLVMQTDRPLGGPSPELLKEETGEKLIGTYTGRKGTKAIFSMTNTTAKDVTYAMCQVYYYDDAGKSLNLRSDPVRDRIGPNATAEKELGATVAEIPPKAAAIEIGCEKVEFSDGTKFVNRNLGWAYRPKGG